MFQQFADEHLVDAVVFGIQDVAGERGGLFVSSGVWLLIRRRQLFADVFVPKFRV